MGTSQHWEFYLCELDDGPASILVDLGAAAVAPVADLPFAAFVRIPLQMPGPEGLSSAEELEQLSRLEDHLVARLPATGATRYVGRMTAAGCRNFLFYTASQASWQQRVAAVMAQLAGFEYPYEVNWREDREWRAYFELLYPSAADLQRIRNRHVCDVLQEHGDAMTAAREIEHWAYFPDMASRGRFLARLDSLGFTVRELWGAGETAGCGVRFSRVDIPSFWAIDEVTLPLYQAASEAGGDYDGWETQVIKPPPT
jgi:hypothetical protein